ncbi:putative ABC transport system permease protein [Neomicrococcus aestuarii]|uniref:Putative ABC transport system permease protein n=1 Tax=Neomicrococcus aestuarii TaxID=556325 RepID=A0A7W8WYT5_9MICC|nr:FtsX-like permease family protein [Neomicrococcus aestuarii]MBB5511580.1 putative ABC transport system permease protein [Neomicrococcus aestuarii]
MKLGPLFGEALRSARSQKVPSLLAILLIAGLCVTVLLTSGRAVGAQQSVLGSIDNISARQLIVTAPEDAGLRSAVIDRIAQYSLVTKVFAFGPAVDARNTVIQGGDAVPFRVLFQPSATHSANDALGSARVSTPAQETLGMQLPAGAVVTASGDLLGVIGSFEPSVFTEPFEPLLVSEKQANANERIATLVITARSVADLDRVEEYVATVLGVQSMQGVSIQKDASVAQLRATVDNQLGSFSSGLVAAIFGLTGVLVAAVLYALVFLRRKDFGRRRALGASRTLILALILIQIGILAAGGAVLGSLVSALWLSSTGDPLPPTPYFAGVAILAVITALIAAVLPALSAARRDPIRELRVA